MTREESAAFLTRIATIVLDVNIDVSILIPSIQNFKTSLLENITDIILDGEQASKLYKELKGESK